VDPRGRPGLPINPPKVIAAERFDVSAALRDTPVPPAKEPGRVMPRTPHNVPPKGRAQGLADPALQVLSVDAAATPATAYSFDGIDNVNGVLPPDANGDVGPNHYVQWVNLSLAIYSKASATMPPALVLGPVPGRVLWSGFGGPCETDADGDPIVLYDHLADRWFMSQRAFPDQFLGRMFGPFYHCIAVSATPDPTGQYYRYQFALEKLGEHPKVGLWSDGYYMSFDQFQHTTLQPAGQGVVAFDRDRMLAGQPASMIYFDMERVDATLGGMLPSDLDGPPPPAGAPAYFVQVDDDAWGLPQDRLQLWGFHVDWSNPAASTFDRLALLPTRPFDSNLCDYGRSCITQPGTSARLDAMSDRLMYRLQYRNFGDHDALVTNHTVDVDGTDHAGIRWYEIRNPGTSPRIFQQGTYAPDSNHRWMGSAAMDGAGNLGIGFSVSGSVWPSIRFTGRLAGDPLNVLTQGEGEIAAGSGSQTEVSSRWGDYSMLAVDPVDQCTFWYTGEYYAATSAHGWRTRIGTFSLPTCVVVPPTVTVTASTPQATESGRSAGVFTVTRDGNTRAPLTIAYTVDGTAEAGSDYTPLSGVVTIRAGAASATITVTPIDDTLFESSETVGIALAGGDGYVLASPSAAVVTIVSDDVPPDLIVSSVTAPALAAVDTDITVTDTTRNQGGGNSPASSTAFYLSANAVLDASDVLLGTRPVPALAAATSDVHSTALHLPSSTAPGQYFVLARADWGSGVPESVETNNERLSAAIAIGPDLVVSSLTVPASAMPGNTISVSDTTSNQGGSGAGGTTTRFYLSTDAVLDASDPLLGSRTVGPLVPGLPSSASTMLTLPASAAGSSYVLAQADALNAVSEASETNNVRVSAAIHISVDLIVSAVSAPAAAAAGASISVTDTTRNQGLGPSEASFTGFYLSSNGALDAADVYIGERAVGALATGGSAAGSATLEIPADTAPGFYFIVASADWRKTLSETSELNNERSSALIKIGPDLSVTSISAPAAGRPGDYITVTDSTRNLGAASSAQSSTGFYLSLNTTLEATDTWLDGRVVGTLLPSATDTASTQLMIPSTLPPGAYFVFAVADWNNAVLEHTENNNSARSSAAVRIGPDLTVTAVTAPLSATVGSTISVGDTLLNQGGATAPASVVKYYLSVNATLEATDPLLGSRPVGALDAGLTVSGSMSVVIPPSTTAGNYTIIAKTDGDDVILEAIENNNTRTRTITITAP
jgi:subtilase family serine protease